MWSGGVLCFLEGNEQSFMHIWCEVPAAYTEVKMFSNHVLQLHSHMSSAPGKL